MKHFRLLRWGTLGLLALAAVFAGHIMVRLGIAADECGTAFVWREWPPYAQWAAFLVPVVLLVGMHCLFAFFAGKALKTKERRVLVVCAALSLAAVVGSGGVSVDAHVRLNRLAQRSGVPSPRLQRSAQEASSLSWREENHTAIPEISPACPERFSPL